MMICIQVGSEAEDLLIEPSDTIEVQIDLDKATKGIDRFTVNGRNAKGIELYNNSFYPIGRKIDEFKGLLDSMRYKNDYELQKIDYALKKIIAPFDSLLKHNLISNNFYRIVSNDIKGVLLTSVVEYLFYYQKKIRINEVRKIVEGIYREYPVTEEIIKSGVNGHTIADVYFDAQARKYYSGYYLPDSIMSVNGKKIVVEQNLLMWLYAPAEVQEIEWPMSLIGMKRIFPGNFSEKDIDAFLTLHPNSPMKEFLKPPYFADDQKRKKWQNDSEIRFLDSSLYNDISSLIVSKFKGKRVLVDFWGTWCIPCKLEFAWNFKIDSFCNKNNIERLYVAFETENTKNRVREEAYKNNLTGVHIVANKNLIVDITEKIYKNKARSYTIPRFLIVDENGKIVNSDASRPSSYDKLFSELKLAFMLTY
ncbi:MAG: redoxin family protein [Bacteroidetes bacterium]|nr:redoxin family protein [Bacteroidota bacterium]